MTEFDPRKPLSRPSTPVSTSWFEFLLDETLLESHLNKDNPEPPATDLIIQFLYHADQAAATAKEIKEKANKENLEQEDAALGEDSPAASPENKKVTALRLLALKAAGHLKWNLDVFDESIPVAMVYYLLSELLKVAIATEPDSHHQVLIDMTTLPDQSLFALQLYHRWCLRTVIRESFPVKPSKVAPLQIPGLLDPNIITAHMKDTVMKIVRDNVKDSLDLLEQCQQNKNPLVMPTAKSFGTVKENDDVIAHHWDQGLQVSASELICQVCYDLGCFLFFQEDYNKAHWVFQEATQLLTQIKEPVFCSVDKSKLAGYMCACNGIVATPEAAQVTDLSLMERVEKAKKDNVENVVSLLLEDNQKCELSLAYRLALEEDLKNKCDGSVLCKICICNMVRQAVESKVILTHYTEILLVHPGPSLEFLIEVSEEMLKTSSFSQRNYLKHFLRYLCMTLSADLHLPDRLLTSSVHALFTEEELKVLIRLSPGHIAHPDIDLNDVVPEKEEEDSIKIGILERHLLVTYDPNTIMNIIQQLLTYRVAKQQVMFLTDKWRLPREIQRGVDSIGVVKMQLYTHILLAKSRICVQLELYDKAKDLLHTAISAVKDLSFKLGKLLRHEQLLIELLQQQQQPGSLRMAETDKEELVKKARTAITMHMVDRDMPPNVEVASLSAMFLLNAEDYKHLSGLQSGPKYVEFCCLMSNLCRELPMIQNSRAPARELWETVSLIFTSTTQQKRTSSGAQNTIHRDGYMGILQPSAFIKLLTKIKNPVAISALLSLLTKLYTTLKDNITCEVLSDYTTLWPTALGNASSLNVATVGDAVTTLIEHALSVNPQQPSWLRTQADLCFGSNQYSQALKYYMEIGVVCTDYFSLHITPTVYDDQVYKKMIKCCSYLQCHTQVAVLCQFTDEVDYATAFKALQERNCNDAMDTYYDCIWDATMLEYIINLHTKRGEFDKRQTALKLIGQLELNGNNPPDILTNAAVARKAKFLQAMAKLYV